LEPEGEGKGREKGINLIEILEDRFIFLANEVSCLDLLQNFIVTCVFVKGMKSFLKKNELFP